MDSKTILRLARMLAACRGWTLATVSTYIAGSGDTLSRLEKGRDLTTRRAGRCAQFLSDHWPVTLEWPADIPPSPAPAGILPVRSDARPITHARSDHPLRRVRRGEFGDCELFDEGGARFRRSAPRAAEKFFQTSHPPRRYRR